MNWTLAQIMTFSGIKSGKNMFHESCSCRLKLLPKHFCPRLAKKSSAAVNIINSLSRKSIILIEPPASLSAPVSRARTHTVYLTHVFLWGVNQVFKKLFSSFEFIRINWMEIFFFSPPPLFEFYGKKNRICGFSGRGLMQTALEPFMQPGVHEAKHNI